MKHSRLICRLMIRAISLSLIAGPAVALAETVQESNTWTYHKEWDKLNNLSYSLARSPLPKRGLYDNLRLEILCKDHRLQFAVDANSLITSQGRSFEFEYQVDDNNPVFIQMRTYPDTKRRGYTDNQVEQTVEDLLAGKSVFIRIQTLIKTVLSAALPLHDAAQPVKQVLADCNRALPGGEDLPPAYSLDDFERDFQQLSEERQRQALS
ncbi:MAG: hypothetical protein ACU83N_09580, partial [Gammaproteobacteria bacterium]